MFSGLGWALLGSSGTQAWSKWDTRSLPVSSSSLLHLVPMACKNKVRVLWHRHVTSPISFNAHSDPTEYPHCPSWANWDLCPRPQNQYPNPNLSRSQGHVSSTTQYKLPKDWNDTAMCLHKPIYFLALHTARLHIPASLAVRCGLMSGLQPGEYG